MGVSTLCDREGWTDPDDVAHGRTATGRHHTHRVRHQQNQMRQQRLGEVTKVFAELTRHKPDDTQALVTTHGLQSSAKNRAATW